MVYIIIIIILIAILGWSALLIGYRDKHTKLLSVHVDQVFDKRCLPIILEHDPPAKKAIIMVHGYPSTPYCYTYAAQRAYQAGYDVYAPLLPGFGTKPADLYNTTFSQWYAFLKNFYEDKRIEYEYLYVLGTSMGGSMTLRLGEEFSGTPEAPDALVTVAAPVFLNDLRLGAIQNWGYYIMRIIALFVPAINPKIHTGDKEVNDGNELWIGYSGSFVRGGVSFMHALKQIRKNLDHITVPLLAIHDEGDKTISFKNLSVIQSAVNAHPFVARPTAMQATHRKHVLLMYKSVQEELMDEILAFLKKTRGAES